MTTSFYWEGDPCNCCGYREEFEIGSSAIGWQFTFCAYNDIQSYQEMLAFLRENDGRIVDEYGREYSVDEFRRWVENPKRRSLRSHIDEYPDGGFKDAEGYDFVGTKVERPRGDMLE